ncbi:MAG: TetR family transcriptional regulator [Polyangiaceae bacterium]|nr:TetR family transcriptional regulator [Myxococcales bacterium]MCB9589126.1 TetR family transcriptional regulator [Polyangiaceae bacterium]
MGRPSNSEERRGQIVEAFARVLAERGYEGATISEIARAAELRSGLIHYHFGSKHEILLALVERLQEGLEARYRSRLGEACDPERALEAYIDAHVALDDASDASAVASWVQIGAEALHDTDVRALYSEALEERVGELRRLFSDVLRARGASTRGAKDYAAVVSAAIEGSFQIGCAAPNVLPRGFAAKAIRRVARGLYEGQEA